MAENDIQQLDKRVTSVENAILNLTHNLNELNGVLRATTQEIKDIGKQNHMFLDDLKEEILNTKTEIISAKSELSAPNWNFWTIAVTIVLALIGGGYYHTQSEANYKSQINEMRINCNREMLTVETEHNREIMELMFKGRDNGKN